MLGNSSIVTEYLVAARTACYEGVDASSRDVYNLLTIVDLKTVALAARGTVGSLADQEETIAGETIAGETTSG
jgi:hypothetical protein